MPSLGLLALLFALCCGLVACDVELVDAPRVALLFATRGQVPLEAAWRRLLEGVAGLAPPLLSPAHRRRVMEEAHVEQLQVAIHEAGRLSANDLMKAQTCASNTVIKDAATQLHSSWGKWARGVDGVRAATRGARVADPSRQPHRTYAAQSLFSLYVHVPPSASSFNPDSIFFGREITPSIEGRRFTHSLGLVTLLLMEAALNDPTVHNARFVMLSESDIPLYHGAVLYTQLIAEKRSRVGPSQPFEQLLESDAESTALSPYMFVPPMSKDYFGKTTQWIALTRAAAYVAVHDRIVEPWFATFSGSWWRCAFIQEGGEVLDGTRALLQHSLLLPRHNAALQLHRHGLLPANFTQGEVLDGIKLETVERNRRRGLPSWMSNVRSFAQLHARKHDEHGLMDAQVEALQAHRAALKVRPPAWAWLRAATVDEQGADASLLMGSQEAGSDGEDRAAIQSQIWESLMSDRGSRGLRSVQARRLLRSRGTVMDNGLWAFSRARQSIVRAGRALLQRFAVPRVESVDTQGTHWPEERLGGASGRDQLGRGLPDTDAAVTTQDDAWSIDIAAANEALRTKSRRKGDAEVNTPLAPKTIWDVLNEPSELNNQDVLPYNIPWPFPSCGDGRNDTACSFQVPLAERPWSEWSQQEQLDHLLRVFTTPASRIVNIVSDECMIKTMLSFYGLVTPAHQTDAFLTHVDWSRGNTAGHPGTYKRAALQFDAKFVRQRLRGTECDGLARTTYMSAGDLFRGQASTAGVDSLLDNVAFHTIWPHVPLPDSCVLFARKFDPDTEPEFPNFLGSCSMLGLDRKCIRPGAL